jgi:hypothetical protein
MAVSMAEKHPAASGNVAAWRRKWHQPKQAKSSNIGGVAAASGI